MSAQTVREQVRWQDLKVRSDLEIVLEIGKKERWMDCELFGHGNMIPQSQESLGWQLIPADEYKYSIPRQAIARVHQLINAGVRIQGVIIADDVRRVDSPASAKPRGRLSFAKAGLYHIVKAWHGSVHAARAGMAFIGKALHGFIRDVGIGMSLIGKLLLGLLRVAGAILLVSLCALAIYFWPVALAGLLVAAIAFPGSKFDPKLVVLVDDGTGGTTWVSLFTWYE